jgi:hypothetical protein
MHILITNIVIQSLIQNGFNGAHFNINTWPGCISIIMIKIITIILADNACCYPFYLSVAHACLDNYNLYYCYLYKSIYFGHKHA